MSAVNYEEQKELCFSKDPAVAVDEIIKYLPKLGDCNETFDFFIGTLLNGAIVGLLEEPKDANEALGRQHRLAGGQAVHDNAIAMELIRQMIGYVGKLYNEDGSEENIYTEEDEEEKFIPASPRKPAVMIVLGWKEKIGFVQTKIKKYIARLIGMNDREEEEETRDRVLQSLADILMYYNDREARASLLQCSRYMVTSPMPKKVKLYLDDRHSERYLRILRHELRTKEEGEKRVNHFIKRMTVDPRHFLQLLDHLLIEDTDFSFFMGILQDACQREKLPVILRDFYYGFLPHELMYLANEPHVFKKRGIIYAIEAICELKKNLKYVKGGQPEVTRID